MWNGRVGLQGIMLASVIALTFTANADTVNLKDGSVLVGKILSAGSEGLRLNTTYAGTVTIDIAQIEKVTRSPAPDTPSGPASAPQAVTASQAAAPAVLPPSPWVGSVTFSGQFGHANGSSQTMSLQSNLERQIDSHRLLVNFDWMRARAGAYTSADNWTVDPGYQYSFAKDWFVALNTMFYHDAVSYIDKRNSVHPAVGYWVASTPEASLSVQLGTGRSWEYTKYGNEDSSIIDWRTVFTHKLGNSPLQFFHRSHLIQNLEGRKNFSVMTKTGFTYQLAPSLNANVQYNYDYQKKPVGNAPKTNSMLLLGLSSQF